jgi:uncharacterized protein (UPF0332 family)
MPITPADFLNSSERLVKQATEVDFRNAASRAYYAAYHKSLILGDSIPEPEGDIYGVHARLIRKFLDHPEKTFREVGQQLKNGRSQRTRADYELKDKFKLSQAQMAIDHSRRVFSLIEKMSSQ